MTSVLTTLGTLALFGTALGFAAFCLLYHVLADWSATEMGRHVMTFMLVCTAILAFVVYATIFSVPPPIRPWVRVIFYGALGTVVWWRVRIFIRVQKEVRGKGEPLERIPHE